MSLFYLQICFVTFEFSCRNLVEWIFSSEQWPDNLFSLFEGSYHELKHVFWMKKSSKFEILTSFVTLSLGPNTGKVPSFIWPLIDDIKSILRIKLTLFCELFRQFWHTVKPTYCENQLFDIIRHFSNRNFAITDG